MNLASQYVTTKASKKRPFNKEEIIDALMAPPLNVDINVILETPLTVAVKMSRNEYIERQIGTTISHKFNAASSCKEDMIIFRSAEDE